MLNIDVKHLQVCCLGEGTAVGNCPGDYSQRETLPQLESVGEYNVGVLVKGSSGPTRHQVMQLRCSGVIRHDKNA